MFNGKFQLGTDITVHPRAYTSPKQTRQAEEQTQTHFQSGVAWQTQAVLIATCPQASNATTVLKVRGSIKPVR